MSDPMDAPWPLVQMPVESMSAADMARLASAIGALIHEDPSLAVTDAEAGQITLGGTSEQHLDLTIRRLREEHDLAVVCGAPQVAYRETLTQRIEKDYTHRKQTLGNEQFARVKIFFEPDTTSAGTRFVSMVGGSAVPPAFIPVVEASIASVAQAGILGGFPVTGVRATLVDGSYHHIGSSALAFEIAARAAFREALREGTSVLLEPIMHVTVAAPETYKGAVTGDISARGKVLEHGRRGEDYVVVGLASLANLFGYTAQLRAMTQGFGSHEIRFDHMRPVPPRGGDRPPPAVAAALRA